MRLLLLLSIAFNVAYASDFSALRARRVGTLTGSAGIDRNDRNVLTEANRVGVSARVAWNNMDKSPGRATLFSGVNCKGSANAVFLNFNVLRTIALGYATPRSEVYGNPVLGADLASALQWMYDNCYHERIGTYAPTDNWYDWEINSALNLLDVLYLAYDVIPADLREKLTLAIRRFNPPSTTPTTDDGRFTATAANLIWKEEIGMFESILSESEEHLSLARSGLAPVFKYATSGDGFYRDGSCIFHNYYAYNGGYCTDTFAVLVQLMYLIDGSEWSLDEQQREIALEWIFNSLEPFVYRGRMMDMVRGRDIGRSYSSDLKSAHSLIDACLYVMDFAPPETAQRLKQMVKSWLLEVGGSEYFRERSIDLIARAVVILNDPEISPRPELANAYVFPSMDRALQLKPGWGLGLSLHSSRLFNYESVNGQNLRGWHTAEGATYLYNGDVEQYRDLFWATADSQRIPGTTVVAGSTPPYGQRSGSPNVGMVTLDGALAAMMQASPPQSTLTARKSWFSFHNEVVALGSGISASEDSPIETIVQNRRTGGTAAPLFTYSGGTQTDFLTTAAVYDQVGWAHLDASAPENSIGYYFPEPMTLNYIREKRTGALSDIETGVSSTPATRNFVTMWLDHGIAPRNATYSYVILPGRSSVETQAYAEDPDINVVEQSNGVHGVSADRLGFRGAAFWETSGGQLGPLRTNRPSVVLIHETEESISLAIADPTQRASSLTLEWSADLGDVIEADPAINVTRGQPTVIRIDTQNSTGRTFRVRFARPLP